MRLALLILALIGSLVGHEQVPPNIIFLMADDQNTLSMGCYGNPEVETPNMDRLANDGMIFDRHYDTTAICMGSRANVFTGNV
jgi:arylsulfatase A-like enzyme